MAHAVCARNEVKDLVVYYLGHEWPLSAKQLHKLLKSQRQVSYQGVHKALRELKEANMIIKRGRKYQLNAEFLRQERDFWVEAQKSYYGVSEHSKRLNTETTLTTGKYVFTKQTLSVRGIPSALISKATFEQLIEHNNKKFLLIFDV